MLLRSETVCNATCWERCHDNCIIIRWGWWKTESGALWRTKMESSSLHHCACYHNTLRQLGFEKQPFVALLFCAILVCKLQAIKRPFIVRHRVCVCFCICHVFCVVCLFVCKADRLSTAVVLYTELSLKLTKSRFALQLASTSLTGL